MRKNVVSPFIELIWEIVSDTQTDSIISWNVNGTSFQILSPVQFADDVLKKHFKHTNISSFVRQLNMYNFHKNKANTTTQEFYHKLFRRDARELLIGIKRKPSEADFREGEEMLKKFLSEKYPDSKDDHQQDHSKEEASEQTPNQFSFDLTSLIRNRLSFSEQSLWTSCSPACQETSIAPKKIPNIIIVNKPMQE